MIGRFSREAFMSPEELSAATGVAVKTLANWRANRDRNGPPFFKIGRKIWYPKDCLERWMDRKMKQ